MAAEFARKLFVAADKDNKGVLTKPQLRKFFQSNDAVREVVLGDNFHWQDFFDATDTNKDGVFDIHEFTASVSASVERNKHELERKRAAELARKIFEAADVDKNKVLSHKEVRNYFKSNPAEREMILGESFHWEDFFKATDTNMDGVFDAEEFTASVVSAVDKNKHGLERKRAAELAQKIFVAADKDKNGVLSHKEVRDYFKSNPSEREMILGAEFTWKAFFDATDTNADGVFSAEEFTASVVSLLIQKQGGAELEAKLATLVLQPEGEAK